MSEPILEPFFRKLRFSKVLAEIKPGSVVVDIGCGHTPHLLNRLERYIKTGVGIDARIKNSSKGKIKLISFLLDERIPLPGRRADYVTLIAVLEHLEKPQAILREAFRVLRPGGTLIITTPTPASRPFLEMLSFWLGMVSQREIAEHKKYFWREELVRAVRGAGFRGVTHQYFEVYMNNFLVARK